MQVDRHMDEESIRWKLETLKSLCAIGIKHKWAITQYVGTYHICAQASFKILCWRISQGTKIFQFCTCPAGRVIYTFHSSCKPMHLSFKSVCNKEHKGVICDKTSSYSSQSTCPTGQVLGKNYSSFLDFTRTVITSRPVEFCPLHMGLEV